eukprot:scaffold37499_cov260-Amphora_coffeaeformis.AAC.2
MEQVEGSEASSKELSLVEQRSSSPSVVPSIQATKRRTNAATNGMDRNFMACGSVCGNFCRRRSTRSQTTERQTSSFDGRCTIQWPISGNCSSSHGGGGPKRFESRLDESCGAQRVTAFLVGFVKRI